MTPDDYNKIVLASVALVTTISGPLAGWYIAHHQTKTQSDIAKRASVDNISAKRQVWIDGVRSDAADFLAHTAMPVALRNMFRRSDDKVAKQYLEGKMLTAFEKAEACGARLELRLNPSETAHQELIAVTKAFDLTAKRFFDKTEPEIEVLIKTYQTQRADIVRRLQAILKAEWTRIKEARV